MRRYFADLLAILSNRYQLCATARHLAVYLLDLFMDHYDVAIKQLYVIALSCLLLASKYSQSSSKVGIKSRLWWSCGEEKQTVRLICTFSLKSVGCIFWCWVVAGVL